MNLNAECTAWARRGRTQRVCGGRLRGGARDGLCCRLLSSPHTPDGVLHTNTRDVAQYTPAMQWASPLGSNRCPRVLLHCTDRPILASMPRCATDPTFYLLVAQQQLLWLSHSLERAGCTPDDHRDGASGEGSCTGSAPHVVPRLAHARPAVGVRCGSSCADPMQREAPRRAGPSAEHRRGDVAQLSHG